MEQTEGAERRKWICCPCCCPRILDLLINAGQQLWPDRGKPATLLGSNFSRGNFLSSRPQTEVQPEAGPLLTDYMLLISSPRMTDRPSNSLERRMITRYARRLPSAVVQEHRVVDHQQAERPGPGPYIPFPAEIDDEPDVLR